VTTIDPTFGDLTAETSLPAFAAFSTDDYGQRSLTVRVNLAAFGGDRWVYDEIIEARDGEITIHFIEDVA
jgi:hypothetical protein